MFVLGQSGTRYESKASTNMFISFKNNNFNLSLGCGLIVFFQFLIRELGGV